MTSAIPATLRPVTGKEATKKLRTGGMIPGVIYGPKQEPVHCLVNVVDLRMAFRKAPQGKNTVMTLSFSDGERRVLLKDYQRDPVKDDVIHVDFLEVKADQTVKITVPLEFVGKPKAVTDGGLFEIKRRELTVRCLPDAIPEKIVIDIASLGMGSTIHIRDVQLPEGVKAVSAVNFTICTIVAPEEDKNAPAADAAAAAPAKGKAAPAKAAAAPAKAPAKK